MNAEPSTPPDDDVIKAFLDGRLPPTEAAALRARADADPALAAEIALVRELRAAGRASVSDHGTELGWRRIERALDASKPDPLRWATRPQFAAWQLAAAAALAVIVWQGAERLAGSPSRAAPGFEMASAPAPSAFVARATFQQDASEGAMRAALHAAGAQIVAGPSALGVYDLAFASPAALEAGMARLRAEPMVVSSIEPAGGVSR